MIVVLIRWFVKNGFEEEFVKTWTNMMKIPKDHGLYREILTSPDTDVKDLKYHTFSLENPHFKTYINVGIWRNIEDFKEYVESRYIPDDIPGEAMRYIELKNFEFKMRERIALKVVADRGGLLPEAALAE